ncbi:Dephospho-CoA kinase [Desulfotomaculum nigrificans CO-1-SRB]|uniref:Dephospho-CoA kinase n=1 Tax=Desulfotomaculum nigrificans (strain DSM 14880 / VKM B-2319 / CO-1-SRB) TaxID=868595 RepID=F6B2R5_DESCC|nr:dephospho-CoA kinase [Desulfotomaculum nigrificans]AEF93894.1 Dephospho-CoA kinase [Desulfotomaculum nigrificans CO-1-SRB]
MIIGLTGNIASGKSSVAKYLRDLGALVIDADQVARRVVMPNTPALREIVLSFGPGILNEDGSLNRRKLGSIVFKDQTARLRLEQITHPRIEEEINRQILSFKESSPDGVLVLEVPLLIEVGWHKKVDQVWLVVVREDVQLHRLVMRDKLSPAEARQRMASQMPQWEKMKYADVIIDNSDSPNATLAQVKKAWSKLLTQATH